MSAAHPGHRLDDAGTPESAWAGWHLERLPELDAGGCRRAVIVAPHPDDEVLGAGGLMQRLAALGTPMSLISVTEGEASHPHSPSVSPKVLVDRRAGERRRALRALGLDGVPVIRLGLADGGVAARTSELIAGLTRWLGPEVLCVAPWEDDGHPDHDASGRAAATACARTGARLLRYLVWTWHWSVPGDDRVPWAAARRLALGAAEGARKRRAIRSFRSQILPLSDRPGDEVILDGGTLRYFRRAYEVFLP